MHSIIIFLSILIILCVAIALVYKSPDNNNKVQEPFANYQDVKTKTINWCDKMQKVGLLNPDQFNQCITTFKDASAGLLPKDFKTPQTGMSRNYSLYNTQSKELTSEITGDNTNTIMLSNIDGLTLASKTDNSVYLVSNINDPTINQSELYFTLVPQSDDVYAILSPYGKYLIANTDYTASFTGTSIGPMASWKITKITSSTNKNADNSGTVMIGSVQFNDFQLVYDNDNKSNSGSQDYNPFKLVYGNADNIIWTMTTKLQNEVDDSGVTNYTGAEYYVTKENILQKIKTTNAQKICIQSALETFRKLYTMISNNFNNIINYVNKKLSDEQKTYKLSTLDYQTRLNSINQNSMINDVVRSNLISTIPQPSGFNISDDDIMVAVNKITNNKNAFLQNLQTNIITPLEEQLKELDALNLDDDYNTYIASLKLDIDNTNNRIRQNNIIMNRQKDTYTKINKNYANQINKEKKIEDIDTVANANIEMINKFSSQNSYLNKLYPVSIFILAIVLIYISYITFIKFRDNIWMNY
jgi:hypothetical protein